MLGLKSFAARLNFALDEMPPERRPPAKGQGRQAYVARMFHISQKGARKWLEGEATPRIARLQEIARRCGVNGEWLLTGQGPMRSADADGEQAPSSRIVHSTERAERAPDRPSANTRTRRLIARLSNAEADGLLSDADVAALEGIVLRLIDRPLRAG